MRALILLLLATAALAEPPEPKFRAVTLDDKVQIGYGVAVADVDGDGAPDVLLADKKQFLWYRNPGGEKARDPAAWARHVLAENLTAQDNVCLAAQDIDGDGKCEIAVGAEWNPGDTEKSGAVFYLIAPADRTQPWEPVKFPSVEPTTHRMRWIKLEEGSWGLVVVPLHGRGNKNGEGAPVKVLCYRKPADPKGEWKAEVVDESMHMTHNFEIERDPHGAVLGLLLGGKEGMAEVVPFAQPGGRETKWGSSRLVSSVSDPIPVAKGGVGEVREGHVAESTQFIATVEPMHGTSLVAYTQPRTTPRTRHVLTDKLTEGHALRCGDLLGDRKAHV